MLDRKKPPAYKQNKSFELLKPEIQELSDTNKLYFINGGEQDVLKLELVFKAGKWQEPHPGISHFTSTLLAKGTADHDSFQITYRFDFYGIHLEIHPGFDFTSIALYGLPKNIINVLDLFLDILSNATFPEDELRQAADIYRQGLKINLEKTNFVAAREFRKYLFGNSHPYGYDIESDNIDRIHRQSLIEFRNNYFGEFTGFISGKISDSVKKSISGKLNQLKFRESKPVTHAKAPSNPGEFHHTKEGSIQTSIRIGKLTIDRHHSDFPGLLLLNHLLGGFFGSRLMKNIREEKGLTYGIHSSIHPLKNESYFVIAADVNSDSRNLAVTEIRAELAQLRNQLVPTKELEVARNHFIGSLQTELNTSFAHSDRIKLITLFKLPSTYYQQLIDQLLSITEIQLNELAGQYYSEEGLYTISIG
jgi:zinc protease